MRRLTRWQVVGVWGAATPVLLAGCGSSPSPTSEQQGVDVAQVEQDAAAIFDALTGTATQREAVHYLQFEALNHGFHECLTGHGQEVSTTFVPIWTGYVSNPTSGAWLGRLNYKPSETALAQRSVALADEAAEAAARVDASDPEYMAAATECVAETPEVNTNSLPGPPAGAQELTGQFEQLMNEVEEELGPISAYQECMGGLGIDLSSAEDEGWQGLYETLTGEMPRPPDPGDEPSAAWTSYLTYETKAIAADTECRQGKYHQGLGLLSPKLDQFAEEHGDEIQRIAIDWAAAEVAAGKAGLPRGPGA